MVLNSHVGVWILLKVAAIEAKMKKMMNEKIDEVSSPVAAPPPTADPPAADHPAADPPAADPEPRTEDPPPADDGD